MCVCVCVCVRERERERERKRERKRERAKKITNIQRMCANIQIHSDIIGRVDRMRNGRHDHFINLGEGEEA